MVRLYLREKAKTSLILLLYTGSSLTRRYAGLINLEKKTLSAHLSITPPGNFDLIDSLPARTKSVSNYTNEIGRPVL